MEGPSLHLAAAQLKPFIGQRVRAVCGDGSVAHGRLAHESVRDIFAWGKHLVLQFSDFALRVHFLLFGSYRAEVNGVAVAGDYPSARTPRLALRFDNGELRLYSCSIRFVEGRRVRSTYDLSTDVLSRAWDSDRALQRLSDHAGEEVADVLLDQEVFAGVGNIIKNEVLCLERLHPATRIRSLSPAARRSLIARTRAFARQFLRWRRASVLTRHLRIHRKRQCPVCGGPVTHKKTGSRARMSHYCTRCQPRVRAKKGSAGADEKNR